MDYYTPQETSPPRPRGSRRILWIGLVALVVVVGSAVAVIVLGDALRLSGTPSRTLAGRVTIVDNDPTVQRFSWSPGTCTGEDEFGDVVEGASVVVKDEKGRTLVVGTLSGGVPARIEPLPGSLEMASECYFLIHQIEVPGRKFYQLQVGRHPSSTVAGEEIGRVAIRLGS